MCEVSVVIPAYNAERTLADTLSSVLEQTFEDFEVLVIDDGSTDRTGELARNTGDPRVRVVTVANGGVARARNRGIGASRGELIAFLDADDLWRSRKLERQVAFLHGRPDVGVCFTAAVRVDADTQPIGLMPAREYADYCAALLLTSAGAACACSSGIVRRALALDVGGFDPSLSQSADWDFWLRLSRITRSAPVSDVLVLYRSYPGNMSSDIALLERDTFAVLDKFFADPASGPYTHLRAPVYSNHWLICSGSYLHNAQLAASVRCLARGLVADPTNISRPLGAPWRWLSRLVRRSRTRL